MLYYDYDDFVRRVEDGGNFEDDNDDSNQYYEQAANYENGEEAEAPVVVVDPALRDLIRHIDDYIFNFEARMRQTVGGGNTGFQPSMQPVLLATRNGKHNGIFASPGIHKQRSKRSGRAQYIKRYSAGMFNRLFSFLQSEQTFALDEVVRVNQLIPLHFDIEIKADEPIPEGRAQLEIDHRYGRALRALRVHVSQGSTFLACMRDMPCGEPTEEVLEKVAMRYVTLSAREWSEGVCQEGLDIIKTSIKSIVQATLEELADARDELSGDFDQEVASDMSVLSACRPGKFSLHVVMQRFYCESQVVSMPLVAFEVARGFAQLNALTLFKKIADNEWEIPTDDNEIDFRIRAMMLSSLLDDDGNARGYDDTPFDEQVYSRNHCMRMPGSSKMLDDSAEPGGVPMSPVRPGGRVMIGNMLFSQNYANTTGGYEEWLKGQIMGTKSLRCIEVVGFVSNESEQDRNGIVVVENMTPSPAYPKKRSWCNDKRQYDKEQNSVTEAEIQEERTLLVVEKTIQWGVRYTESRKMRERETFAAARNAATLPWDRGGREDGVVERDEVFTMESGEMKPFSEISVGGWFRHRHDGGREENTASATKCSMSCFRCFGCGRTFYQLVTCPFESPYPFRASEITASGDPFAYVPRQDWVGMFMAAKRKQGPTHVVIDAPKGSGKTELCGQLTEIFGYPSRSNGGRVLATHWGGDIRLMRRSGIDLSANVLCDWHGVLHGKCLNCLITREERKEFRQKYEENSNRAFDAMVSTWKPNDVCTKCGSLTHYKCQQEYEKQHPRETAGGVPRGITVLCSKCSLAVKNKASICVVSFRQALARQQAERLGLECYMDVKEAEISSDGIVVCVNSVGRLSDRKAYDIVILDEGGLVRRHFVSHVTERVLPRAYARFATLLREADMVVILQHGLSLEDIRFFTHVRDADAEDRRKVAAIKFTKPARHHPIRVVKDFPKLVFEMLQVYKNTIVDGVCNRPFMVFCSSSSVAGALRYLLRQEAEACGGDPTRIHLLTRGMKTTPFNTKFLGDTNRHSSEADVVVCTSVVGAGFDISSHFHCFFGFLYTNILPFHEECQFLGRLRLNAMNRKYNEAGEQITSEEIPSGDSRQSYLWVEDGYGRLSCFQHVCKAQANIRKLIRESGLPTDCSIVSEPSSVDSLSNTSARVTVEHSATNSQHKNLWRTYLTHGIPADLVHLDYEIEMTDGACKLMYKRISEYRDQVQLRKLHFLTTPNWANPTAALEELTEIFNTVHGSDRNAETSVDVCASILAQETASDAQNLIIDFHHWQNLIKHCYPNHQQSKHPDEIAYKSWMSKAKANITRVLKLASWLYFHYGILDTDFNPDTQQRIIEEENLKAFFSSRRLNQWGQFRLACKLLPLLLSPLGGKIAYVRQIGTLPFFTNATVVQDISLCEFLLDYYNNNPADQPLFTSGSGGDNDWRTSPKGAHNMIKNLCKAVGLTLRTNTQKTSSNNGKYLSFNSITASRMDLATLLDLKSKRHHSVRSTILLLCHANSRGTNLITSDHEMLVQAVQAYNECYPENRKALIGHDSIHIPTITRRLQEIRRDAPVYAAGEDLIDTEDEEDTSHYDPADIEAAHALGSMAQNVAHQADARNAEAQDARAIAVLEEVVVEDEPDPKPKRRRRRRCSFIAYEADDDDDDDDESENDEDMNADDSNNNAEEDETPDFFKAMSTRMYRHLDTTTISLPALEAKIKYAFQMGMSANSLVQHLQESISTPLTAEQTKRIKRISKGKE